MKKMYSLLATIMMIVSLFAVMPTAAQTPEATTQTVVGPSTYTVQDGDTVWGLNPNDWPKIEAANPMLFAQSGRHFTLTDGRPGLLIKPGEVLNIPAGVTVTFKHGEPIPPTAKSATPAPIVVTPTTPADYVTYGQIRNLGLLLLLLLLAAMALIAFLLYRAIRNRLLESDDNSDDNANRILDELQSMEERQNNAADLREGLMLSFYHTISSSIGHLFAEIRDLRGLVIRARNEHGHDIRQIRRQMQTVSRPDIHVTAPAAHEIDGNTVDFVEVHRLNGERFSMTVAHGSSITPTQDGVQATGQVTLLTEVAARRQRSVHEAVREERAESPFAEV